MNSIFKKFRVTVLKLAVLASLVSLPTNAQLLPQESQIVRDISIQYVGPATVNEELILGNMKTTVGQPYNERFVEEDIRALFGTEEISNVRIFSEPLDDGVRVVVVVQTKATVREVLLKGVDRKLANRLRKRITTIPGGTLSEETIEGDRQIIIDYYQERGFSNVKVEYDLDVDDERGTAKVAFDISEGGKATVRKVLFEGNTAVTEKDLRKQMETKGRNLLTWINKSGRLQDEVLAEDLLKIEEYYANLGYIDAKVENVRRDRIDDKRIDLVITVNEGLQYTVNELTIEGNELYTSDEILANLRMLPGEIYTPRGLQDDTKILRDMYGSRGYVDLLLIPESASAGDSQVNLSYRLDEGFQSYVEQINIEGNTKTKDKVLRRELALLPGEIFDTTSVETSKLRLQNLGYFSRVDTFENDTLIPGRKDLNIVVEEKRTGSFNFGAGFSSIDSLIGFAEITQSNFDITNWPGLTGGGQKFRARVQIGTERQDLVLALTEPWFLDQKLAVGGELYYRESAFFSDVYDQTNIGGQIFARKPIGRFSSIEGRYTLQQVEIDDFSGRVSEEILSEGGERIESRLGALYVYDTRDSVFLSRSGERIEAEIYGAGGFLSGDVDYYGFRIEGTKYWSLPYDGIFFINAELAVVDVWNGADAVPIWARQYLGGANSLRGYDFREVGPKDEFGEPIGGGTLVRATFEYTFPIIERIRGAVFYDVGFVADDAYSFDTGDMGSDIGIGVRMELPIGPVRIDFGYPLQTDEFNDSTGKFNFNVGYQF